MENKIIFGKRSTPGSSMTSNRYKNFLTSLLSPPIPKRQPKKEALCSPGLEEDKESSAKRNYGRFEQSSESIYFPVGDLEDESYSMATSNPNVAQISSEIDYEARTSQSLQTSISHPKLANQETLYASVKKDDKKILQERLKELSEENRQLRKQIQDIIHEEKRKEENHYAKLQLKITQLEAETRKEVKSLTDRIQILVQEKGALNDQIDILHRERWELQLQCKSLTAAADFHKKMAAEYKKLLNEAKQRHEKEISETKEQDSILQQSQCSLMEQVSRLREELASSITKTEALDNSNREMFHEKTELLQQVEESKHLEEDTQNLIVALLKVTESIAVERDMLLNKTSFRESQQTELQTTVVDYSLNIGRLQEHILNLSKENAREVLKLKSKELLYDDSLQEVYGKQLDILREKILNQNNIIIDLEKEKRQLETQVENIYDSVFFKGFT